MNLYWLQNSGIHAEEIVAWMAVNTVSAGEEEIKIFITEL
jgi:hypothetical protein